MNPTAVLHGGFGLMVLVGFLISDPTLRIGAFGLGVILFVAGIVVARRGDE
ncbi:hypothetical protein [Halorubrum sp. SY-15]|jgi:uncharacterized membrane protein YphA (DoxX/SURF4 family)|uniref:hypothetical protein n=1 Tax=Halorubrum sp. SY-15 TaxID=3402277 RepID=UPI003EB975C1